jgi:lipoprotein signal peptidase
LRIGVVSGVIVLAAMVLPREVLAAAINAAHSLPVPGWAIALGGTIVVLLMAKGLMAYRVRGRISRHIPVPEWLPLLWPAAQELAGVVCHLGRPLLRRPLTFSILAVVTFLAITDSRLVLVPPVLFSLAGLMSYVAWLELPTAQQQYLRTTVEHAMPKTGRNLLRAGWVRKVLGRAEWWAAGTIVLDQLVKAGIRRSVPVTFGVPVHEGWRAFLVNTESWISGSATMVSFLLQMVLVFLLLRRRSKSVEKAPNSLAIGIGLFIGGGLSPVIELLLRGSITDWLLLSVGSQPFPTLTLGIILRVVGLFLLSGRRARRFMGWSFGVLLGPFALGGAALALMRLALTMDASTWLTILKPISMLKRFLDSLGFLHAQASEAVSPLNFPLPLAMFQLPAPAWVAILLGLSGLVVAVSQRPDPREKAAEIAREREALRAEIRTILEKDARDASVTPAEIAHYLGLTPDALDHAESIQLLRKRPVEIRRAIEALKAGRRPASSGGATPLRSIWRNLLVLIGVLGVIWQLAAPPSVLAAGAEQGGVSFWSSKPFVFALTLMVVVGVSWIGFVGPARAVQALKRLSPWYHPVHFKRFDRAVQRVLEVGWPAGRDHFKANLATLQAIHEDEQWRRRKHGPLFSLSAVDRAALLKLLAGDFAFTVEMQPRLAELFTDLPDRDIRVARLVLSLSEARARGLEPVLELIQLKEFARPRHFRGIAALMLSGPDSTRELGLHALGWLADAHRDDPKTGRFLEVLAGIDPSAAAAIRERAAQWRIQDASPLQRWWWTRGRPAVQRIQRVLGWPTSGARPARLDGLQWKVGVIVGALAGAVFGALALLQGHSALGWQLPFALAALGLSVWAVTLFAVNTFVARGSIPIHGLGHVIPAISTLGYERAAYEHQPGDDSYRVVTHPGGPEVALNPDDADDAMVLVGGPLASLSFALVGACAIWAIFNSMGIFVKIPPNLWFAAVFVRSALISALASLTFSSVIFTTADHFILWRKPWLVYRAGVVQQFSFLSLAAALVLLVPHIGFWPSVILLGVSSAHLIVWAVSQLLHWLFRPAEEPTTLGPIEPEPPLEPAGSEDLSAEGSTRREWLAPFAAMAPGALAVGLGWKAHQLSNARRYARLNQLLNVPDEQLLKLLGALADDLERVDRYPRARSVRTMVDSYLNTVNPIALWAHVDPSAPFMTMGLMPQRRNPVLRLNPLSLHVRVHHARLLRDADRFEEAGAVLTEIKSDLVEQEVLFRHAAETRRWIDQERHFVQLRDSGQTGLPLEALVHNAVGLYALETLEAKRARCDYLRAQGWTPERIQRWLGRVNVTLQAPLQEAKFDLEEIDRLMVLRHQIKAYGGEPTKEHREPFARFYHRAAASRGAAPMRGMFRLALEWEAKRGRTALATRRNGEETFVGVPGRRAFAFIFDWPLVLERDTLLEQLRTFLVDYAEELTTRMDEWEKEIPRLRAEQGWTEEDARAVRTFIADKRLLAYGVEHVGELWNGPYDPFAQLDGDLFVIEPVLDPRREEEWEFTVRVNPELLGVWFAAIERERRLSPESTPRLESALRGICAKVVEQLRFLKANPNVAHASVAAAIAYTNLTEGARAGSQPRVVTRAQDAPAAARRVQALQAGGTLLEEATVFVTSQVDSELAGWLIGMTEWLDRGLGYAELIELTTRPTTPAAVGMFLRKTSRLLVPAILDERRREIRDLPFRTRLFQSLLPATDARFTDQFISSTVRILDPRQIIGDLASVVGLDPVQAPPSAQLGRFRFLRDGSSFKSQLVLPSLPRSAPAPRKARRRPGPIGMIPAIGARVLGLTRPLGWRDEVGVTITSYLEAALFGGIMVSVVTLVLRCAAAWAGWQMPASVEIALVIGLSLAGMRLFPRAHRGDLYYWGEDGRLIRAPPTTADRQQLAEWGGYFRFSYLLALPIIPLALYLHIPVWLFVPLLILASVRLFDPYRGVRYDPAKRRDVPPPPAAQWERLNAPSGFKAFRRYHLTYVLGLTLLYLLASSLASPGWIALLSVLAAVLVEGTIHAHYSLRTKGPLAMAANRWFDENARAAELVQERQALQVEIRGLLETEAQAVGVTVAEIAHYVENGLARIVGLQAWLRLHDHLPFPIRAKLGSIESTLEQIFRAYATQRGFRRIRAPTGSWLFGSTEIPLHRNVIERMNALYRSAGYHLAFRNKRWWWEHDLVYPGSGQGGGSGSSGTTPSGMGLGTQFHVLDMTHNTLHITQALSSIFSLFTKVLLALAPIFSAIAVGLAFSFGPAAPSSSPTPPSRSQRRGSFAPTLLLALSLLPAWHPILHHRPSSSSDTRVAPDGERDVASKLAWSDAWKPWRSRAPPSR